jgi:hypothetical protein
VSTTKGPWRSSWPRSAAASPRRLRKSLFRNRLPSRADKVLCKTSGGISPLRKYAEGDLDREVQRRRHARTKAN